MKIMKLSSYLALIHYAFKGETYQAYRQRVGIVGNPTRVYRVPNMIATDVLEDQQQLRVRYHWTDVVTYDKPGEYAPGVFRVSVSAGGYLTATTKARINQFSPARVWASKRDGGWWIEWPTQPAKLCQRFDMRGAFFCDTQGHAYTDAELHALGTDPSVTQGAH